MCTCEYLEKLECFMLRLSWKGLIQLFGVLYFYNKPFEKGEIKSLNFYLKKFIKNKLCLINLMPFVQLIPGNFL